MMNRSVQLGVIALVVIAISSGVSHFAVRRLGILSRIAGHRVIGDRLAKPFGYLAGSSLMYGGLALDRVTTEFGQGLETWFVAGSSSTEWEPFQALAPEAKLTLLGVSAYDLNENYLCDFRSQIVPLRQALRDLTATRSSWPFIRRVLSQYPLQYLRILFPTVGRSAGVMGGLKEQFRKLFRSWVSLESDAGPKVPSGNGPLLGPEQKERISDWTPGYLMRSLDKIRSAHSYNGPKKLALLRILEQGRRQGQVIVVVLPVSLAYRKEFLAAETARKFENALRTAQLAVPEVLWIRLDQISQLNSNDYFWDLVHLNFFGRQIATDAFLEQWKGKVPKK